MITSPLILLLGKDGQAGGSRDLNFSHGATKMEHMRKATVRDLRNRYSSLLRWIRAGEEILITQRGKPVARLVPERVGASGRVDWWQSPAVARDRSAEPVLTAEESAAIIQEAGGRW